MNVEVLAVSDEVDQRIYTPSIRERMGDVDMIIGCGDLPASYLEFLVDAVNRPVYYVLGNHAEELTRHGERGEPRHPQGCIDLGGKVVRDPATGLIMAGLPGSPRYAEHEPVQYTEFQMNWMMLKMTPRLFWNRFRYGRYLDLLVTHAPPRDVNDREDRAHRGFNAMRKFLRRFRPTYQLHGHVHLYDRSQPFRADFLDTEVINVFPYQRLSLAFDAVAASTVSASPGVASDRRSQPEMEHRS
jgi:Icc-related predicted phosphoesterase